MVELREVEPDDLPIFFECQADPIAVELADVPSRDQAAFDEHWAARVLGNPETIVRTITVDREPAGHCVSFLLDGERMVGYWIARRYWGRGITTEAFARFLELETRRPVYARTAIHNAASIRILTNAGFVLRKSLPDGYEFVLEQPTKL